MSSSTPALLSRSSPSDGAIDGPVRRVRRSLAALSFWGAIALPSVYLPLLVAGLETTGGLTAFLLLFGLHVFALVGGRRYGRTGR